MKQEIFSSFTARDGKQIAYVDMGSGIPLLFVHGFGGSTAVQLPIFEILKNKFRCICFDQRGYGRTGGTTDTGVVQSAHDAKEFLEHLNIDNVVMLGYSMGAAVAFSYIRAFGCARIYKLIIGEMSPKMINEDGWKYGLYQGWYTRQQYEHDLHDMTHGNYARFNTYFVSQLVAKSTSQNVRDFIIYPDTVEKAKKHGASAATIDALLNVSEEQIASNTRYWQSMADDDFRPVLPQISVPTAIVYATPGSIYGVEAAEYMKGQLPDATMYPLTDCTHMAKNEKMEDFIRIVTEFSYA